MPGKYDAAVWRLDGRSCEKSVSFVSFNHSIIPRVYSLHIIARQNLTVVRTKDRNGTPNTRECVSDVLTFVTPQQES